MKPKCYRNAVQYIRLVSFKVKTLVCLPTFWKGQVEVNQG